MTCCSTHQHDSTKPTSHGHQSDEPSSSHSAAYTCPMHPEVKSDQPGPCPQCGMDLVKSEGQHHQSMHMGPQAARDFLRRFLVVTFLLIPLLLTSHLAQSLLGIPQFSWLPYFQFAIATAIFLFSLVFFQHAGHEIKGGTPGMMTLVSIAVGAGFAFSIASTFLPQLNVEFYLEISTLIWVLLFGHFLEAKSSTAAGDALNEVAKLLPSQAHLIIDGQVKTVSVDQLKETDIVKVKPGEKVPADGEIIKGYANFNESLISGESKPVKREKGDRVVAGSICQDGSVEVKLTKVGENSTIGQIQNLIKTAQSTKPSAQSLADKAAAWLTYVAVSAALLSILVWSVFIGKPFVFSLTLAITVLVIACPHALGLAIPTVTTIATRLAVQNGLFIKDLKKLEVVKKADYVLFDKTGTLTEGEFGVSQLKPFSDIRHDQLLSVAASLESHSSHVIGQAIVKHAQEENIDLSSVTDFQELAGRGVKGTIDGQQYSIGNHRLMDQLAVWTEETKKAYQQLQAQGKTTVCLCSKDEVLGLIALSDKVKPQSKQAVKQLHQQGLKVAMVTGDAQKVADTVAQKLDIDKVFAEVLPEDKYKFVKKLQNQGNTVIMVGDGINDAPALTQSDVGVAVGAGTDVAVEAGDVVLTHSQPDSLVSLVALSKKVYAKMIQNLFWALGYNIVAIPSAAGLFIPLGFKLSPSVGAILMSLSSVIVVINALTLLRSDLSS